jgi:hypothetical protein
MNRGSTVTSEAVMISFDIFQKLPNGIRLWICNVGSLQEAKDRLTTLQQSHPAEYYVCDLASRKVMMAVTREQPGIAHGLG